MNTQRNEDIFAARIALAAIAFLVAAFIIGTNLSAQSSQNFSDDTIPLPDWTIPVKELLKSNPNAVLDGLAALKEDAATTGSATFGRIDVQRVAAIEALLNESPRVPARHGKEERYVREVLAFLNGPAAVLIDEQQRNGAVQYIVVWSKAQLAVRARYLAALASAE